MRVDGNDGRLPLPCWISNHASNVHYYMYTQAISVRKTCSRASSGASAINCRIRFDALCFMLAASSCG